MGTLSSSVGGRKLCAGLCKPARRGCDCWCRRTHSVLTSSHSSSSLYISPLSQWFPVSLRNYHTAPLTPSPSAEHDLRPRIWESEYVAGSRERQLDTHSSDEERNAMSADDNDFPEEHWSRIKAEVRSSLETETVVSDDTETTECVCIAPLR